MNAQLIQGRGKRILIDGREFAAPKITGIGRILLGLTDAIAEAIPDHPLVLCLPRGAVLPEALKAIRRLHILPVPRGFLASEAAISWWTRRRDTALFISAYPKLPIMGVRCPCINMVHDVHDITFAGYASLFRRRIGVLRIQVALRRSDTTWYISGESLRSTRSLAGITGKKAVVRHLGLGTRFAPESEPGDDIALERAGLASGYVLAVGNGMPHKNLGILLKISHRLTRKLVLAGVSQTRRRYWEQLCPDAPVIWIERVPERLLPVLYRNAYLLAQPSFAEGYGYPPLEAMACGTPAVVSDIAVMKETTGGNALFASPNHPEAWIQAFSALEDENLYRLLTRKSLEWTSRLIGRAAWNGHIDDIRTLLAHGRY